ncbi:MAG: rhamnan synthesis F family protein [Pseudomonadota bacterium]
MDSRDTEYLKRSLKAARAEADFLIQSRRDLEATLAAFEQSRFWRMTSPLRKLINSISGPASDGVGITDAPITEKQASALQAISNKPSLGRTGKQTAVDPSRPGKLVAIFHAFHTDLVPEVTDRLSHSTCFDRVIVTCPNDRLEEVKGKISKLNIRTDYLAVENVGRDIAPFIQALSLTEPGDVILKLHTKKSPYLSNGREWRTELYDSLLLDSCPEKAKAAFASDPTLGMLGPGRHWLAQDGYIGGNTALMEKTVAAFGLDMGLALQTPFVGGTMFYVRRDALCHLSDLSLDWEAFDPPTKESHVSLAHVFERLFGVFVEASGHRLAPIDDPLQRPFRRRAGEYRFVVST